MKKKSLTAEEWQTALERPAPGRYRGGRTPVTSDEGEDGRPVIIADSAGVSIHMPPAQGETT